MIKRKIEKLIIEYSNGFPVVSLTGPRQSGKTTLVKKLFSDYDYVNLENASTLDRARRDPLKFLSTKAKGLIIDEAQKAPELFSYIQIIVDKNKRMGEFIITGSQNFLLLEKISQSLAGRAGVLHLLPFTLSEIKTKKLGIDEQLIKGSYPPLYDREVTPYAWCNSYIQNYIERDVRQIINVKDLSLFQRFLKLCSGRIGQLVSYTDISNSLGVSSVTVKEWISILETSFITFGLQPYYKNFNKRIVKQPKLYFYDTGLVCALLGITTTEILENHPLRGYIFENFIVSEHIKKTHNNGLPNSYYFWRDNHGLEVDLVEETALGIKLIEVKSSYTIRESHMKNLDKLEKISNVEVLEKQLFYSADNDEVWGDIKVRSWKSL